MICCVRGIAGGLRARLAQPQSGLVQGARAYGSAPRPSLHLFSQRSAAPQRGLAFKPREAGRKVKVDVKEESAKEWWQQAEKPVSQSSLQRQPYEQQPYYDEERARGGTQYESVTAGVQAHLQKVYATLCAGIGVAAGASMVSMATGLAAMIPPIVPGLLALAPMVYLVSFTNKYVRCIPRRSSGWRVASCWW